MSAEIDIMGAQAIHGSEPGHNTRTVPRNYCPENIAGKSALVTGGTTGIGRAIAQMLLEHGAKVIVFGRDKEDLDDALHDFRKVGEVYGVTADHSRIVDIERVFQEVDLRFDGLDILVNNAAGHEGSVLDTKMDDILNLVQGNIFGYMGVTREAGLRMKAKGRGHIVNVGSLSAETRETEAEIYVATKAAIQAFSASLRKTVNPLGIKVSLIEPGLVATDLTSSTPAEQRKKVEQGEMIEPMDIAEAVHYCLTQPARCDVITVQVRPHLQSI